MFRSQLLSAAGVGLIVASSTLLAARPLPAAAQLGQPTIIAQAQARSGQFVRARYDTSGKASIVKEGDRYFLELDDSFQTSRGPDLFVLLHRSANPQSYRSQDYVNLGKLKKLKGKQRYSISAKDAAKLANYKSAVIWCKQFNVTFGYAAL